MCFLHVDAHAGKQPDKQRYDIRISYKDTTLRYVTDAITRQVGIVFSYDNSISSHHMPASNINLKRVPVERLLEEIFTPAGITFNVVNDVVILQKMAPDTPALTKIKHLVSGTVRDADGQPLAGVSVYISGTDIGTSSPTMTATTNFRRRQTTSSGTLSSDSQEPPNRQAPKTISTSS